MGEEQIVVEWYDVEEEGNDTSYVPETSQSFSETLETEDTLTSSKNATEGRVLEGNKKKTFTSLFQDNRNPSKGISLYKVENLQGVAKIDMVDVTDIVQTWGYSLVGYVAGGFPGLDTINKLRASWKVFHKFSIHKSWWIVYRFHKGEDRENILNGGPYIIYGRPLILKHMPPLFQFGPCTNTIIPVWVNLPGLLLDLWNENALPKICLLIGNSVCTDVMTREKTGFSMQES